MDDPPCLLGRRILAALRRHGEMGQCWLASTVGGGRGVRGDFDRDRFAAALSRLEDAGLVACRRSVEPLYHGARVTRPFTYWRALG